MSKSKFKVGDYVVIADKYRNKYNAIVGVGEVICITPTNNRLLYSVRFEDKAFEPAFYSYELNLYTPAFKVGDKVYITEQAQKWMIEHGDKKYLTPEPKEIVYVGTYMGVTVYELKGIDDLIFYLEDLSVLPVGMLATKEDESKEYKDCLNEKEYRERLASNWKEICNRYLEAFCNKHGYKYEPDMWIGSDPGTIVEVCDMFVSMDNIRYDVDNNIPDPDFEHWYWKSLELHELGVEHWMNFPSYCKGAPDEWTEERMKNLRAAHQRVEEAKKDLEKTISEQTEKL